ncbi:MAG: NAD-dependent epimerase/dehydratase family protein, partial [Gemmobacter sp.]
MADTVVLTGVTGFLGGHLALELLASGYHVRGSLRNPARANAVRAALTAAGADVTRLSFVTLDLTRDAGWAEAMAGARFLIHAASPFVTTMPKDKAELIGPAVAGTERALAAALAAGVERIVLTSSSVAIVNGRGTGGPALLGAADWADPESGRLNAYAESKVRAERRAWDMLRGQEQRLVVVNPGFITGPLLDEDPGTSGALVQRFLRGQIPLAPDLTL